MVNGPVFMAIVGCPGLAIYLSKQGHIPNWGIGIGFLVGLALAWLLWSFLITKWRIWALEHVRNVHELKKQAIQQKLIWTEGSFFEKTEIRSRKDIIKLEQLHKKFQNADVYKEDYSLPAKTEIYFSKLLNYFELAFAPIFFGIGVYLLLKDRLNAYIIGTLLCAFGGFYFIKALRRSKMKDPQITLDSKGMRTAKVGFRSWEAIRDEEVILEGSGKSSGWYLVYFYDEDQFEKMGIDALNVSPRQLEIMLRTYRIRHTKGLRLSRLL